MAKTHNYPTALRKAGLAALVACTLCLALVEPAQAQRVTATCTTLGGDLEGNAHYVSDGVWDQWYLFAGLITNNGNDKSNINFYFYPDYQLNWVHHSPDRIRANQPYSVGANIVIPVSSVEQV